MIGFIDDNYLLKITGNGFIQDLENSLRNHPEERLEKIEELGNEIVGHQCMAESILADVKCITDRWNSLQNQVRFECGFAC